MKTALLFCLALAVVGNASAAQKLTVSILLDDAPCSTQAGIFAKATPEIRSKLKAAKITASGQDEVAACWAPYDEEFVLVLTPDGEKILVEKKSLVPVRLT